MLHVKIVKFAWSHSTKKPVTTMLTYPWKCTVLHCNHLGNTWKPLVLMTRHFDYCPSASEGDNQSVRSSAPVVSRCFPGGYNVKLYISRGRLAWWLLAFFAQCPLISCSKAYFQWYVWAHSVPRHDDDLHSWLVLIAHFCTLRILPGCLYYCHNFCWYEIIIVLWWISIAISQ